MIVAIGMGILAMPGVGGSYRTTFFPALIVLGVGMSLSVAPLTTVVMNSVDTPSTGRASRINNAAARIARLLAVAMLGVVVLTIFSTSLETELLQVETSTRVKIALLDGKSDLAGTKIPNMVPQEMKHPSTL